MSSIKALKKLAKKVDKKQSKAKKQLNSLAFTKHHQNRQQTQLIEELKSLSQQTLTSITAELATPFNPLLSWFSTGIPLPAAPQHQAAFTQGGATHQLAPKLPSIQAIRPAPSLAKLPLKSPACKRCPALAGGNCKCAMKKFAL